VPLRITTVTGETHEVQVPTGENERARAKEILHGGGQWVEISDDAWVRRDSIVKIEVAVTARATGFS
jgi:hypothetical protein